MYKQKVITPDVLSIYPNIGQKEFSVDFDSEIKDYTDFRLLGYSIGLLFEQARTHSEESPFEAIEDELDYIYFKHFQVEKEPCE